MANWLNRLDFADIWNSFDLKEITVQQTSARVRERILILCAHNHPGTTRVNDLMNIAEQFNKLSKDETANIDSFDVVLRELYDWADTNHNCWVNTFSS